MKKFYITLSLALVLSSCSFLSKHPEIVNEITDAEKEMIQDYMQEKDKKENEKLTPIPCPSPITNSGVHDNVSEHIH